MSTILTVMPWLCRCATSEVLIGVTLAVKLGMKFLWEMMRKSAVFVFRFSVDGVLNASVAA
jgi:hypothetical protein